MVLSGGRLAKETNNDGGVKDFTVTPITDTEDKIHNAQDVNVVNSNDIEVKMTGEGMATAANQTSGDQKTQVTKLPPSILISPTITVDTAAYSIGDSIGGKLTLTSAVASSGGTGILQNITVVDASNIKPALEILIFNADPTAATLTDQAAIALSTDVSKVIDRITINTSDYVTVAGIAIAKVNIGDVIQAVGSANLYAAINAVAAHDFVAATDLQVKFGFMRD